MTARRHRPFQVLTLTAALLGLLPLAFAPSLGEPALLAGAFFAWAVAIYLLATAGTLAAATSFGPGEAMRPGWLLLSGSYAVLVVARLALGAAPGGLLDGPGRLPGLSTALNILSSGLAVAGFLSMARAWRDTGLDLSTPGARLALQAGALVVGALLAGPDLVDRLPPALAGDALAVGDVVTDLLDVALFVVAVPVLRAALSLGGGLVAWPWGLLTLSLLAWLGYDASLVWGEGLGLTPRSARLAQEVMRSLAAAGVGTAGVAQRWVMRSAPGDAPEDGAAL